MASIREPVSLAEKQTIVGEGFIGPDLDQVQKSTVHGYSFSAQSSSSKEFVTCACSSCPFLRWCGIYSRASGGSYRVYKTPL